MEDADATLIELAKKGDDDAFDALTVKYLPAVYTFCIRYTGNPEDAQDIAQETFVKAWRALKKFDTEKNVKPWLFQIAKNTATDLLRKRRAVPFSDLTAEESKNDFSDTLPDPEPLPDSIFETKELAKKVSTALSSLPPRDRLLLTLRYEQELSFEEIAEVLEIPSATVRSLHRRALIRLREYLYNHATKHL